MTTLEQKREHGRRWREKQRAGKPAAQRGGARKYPVIDGKKRCTMCGEELPFTAEFFCVNRSLKSGLSPQCRPCLREAGKRSRLAHPEACKAASKRWRQEHPERMKELKSAWSKANRDRVSVWEKRWRASHRDHINAWKREWRSKRPGYWRDGHRAWKSSHRAQVCSYEHRRRARRLGSLGNYTAADIARILTQQNHRCFYCQADISKKCHVEHKTPLSRGGSNGPENIVCSCASCNFKKHTKTDAEFIWNTPRHRVQSARRHRRKTHQLALPIEQGD